MKIIRTVNLSVERHETLVVSGGRRNSMFWCKTCGVDVRMSGPEQAAQIAETSSRSIYSMIERGDIHFIEGRAEGLLVCLNSIFDSDALQKLDSTIGGKP